MLRFRKDSPAGASVDGRRHKPTANPTMMIAIEIRFGVETCSPMINIELLIPNTGISNDSGATVDTGYSFSS